MHGNNFTMNLSWVILLVLGVTVSSIFTIILIWFSKKNISADIASLHILHMLNTQGVSRKEILETVNASSTPITPGRVPLMLAKLQGEGLIERQGNSYVITFKGVNTLNRLDPVIKELQNIANMALNLPMSSKFIRSGLVHIVKVISGVHVTGAKETITPILEGRLKFPIGNAKSKLGIDLVGDS